MPKGIYDRKGRVAHNKGKEAPHKILKIEKLKLGLLIECKKHGEHLKWRLHSDNNVQCLHCAAYWQRERKKRMPFKVIFNATRRHARDNDRSFTITYEDLIELNNQQNGKCALSQIKFNDEYLPSLDRIDSSKGYEKGNIQLLLIKVNRMKTDLNENEFIMLCKKISEAKKGNKK